MVPMTFLILFAKILVKILYSVFNKLRGLQFSNLSGLPLFLKRIVIGFQDGGLKGGCV